MSSAVHFLDVGQAHATVAVDADSAMVVDCPLSGVEQASSLLARENPAKLDVVVTHRDLDHCGGIPALIRDFGNNSTKLYMNPVAPPSARRPRQPRVETVLHGILSALDWAGASPEHALAGAAGSTGRIKWSVHAPSYKLVLGTALVGGSINRSSVVLTLLLGNYRFLIPGDIDDVAVGELLNSGTQLSADVLLLPHHGARLTRINQLLAAVDPLYVIVSAGRQQNHPHIATLQAAASYTCRLMCTQVTFHCHGGSVSPEHCAGSITFDLAGGSLLVKPSIAEHRSRIAGLSSPVCLSPSPSRTGSGTTGSAANPSPSPLSTTVGSHRVHRGP